MAIEGVVEEILPGRVRGWCFDQSEPNTPLMVTVKVNGVEVTTVPADVHRSDLLRAGKGNGFHSFKAVHSAIDPTADVQTFAQGDHQAIPIIWNARQRLVRSIEELDLEIGELAKLGDGTIEQFNRCNSFYFYEDLLGLPKDPRSQDYKRMQLDLYSKLTGIGSYNPWKSEPIKISVEESADPHPFPFSTRDPDCIGCHLIALGQILLALKETKKSANVLEYGCGTGFTTIFLAASGYDVTAVDINLDALQVVDKLAKARSLSISTFNGEFGQVPDRDKVFDAIIFYEAFHHCLEFEDLLCILFKKLHSGGVVIFAGEPIYEDFPKPWGLRMDGHAVHAIRKIQWLELGFSERFFTEIVTAAGFSLSKRAFDIGPPMFIARKP